MKINEITLDPSMIIPGDPLRLRVGEPIVENGFVVEKITYNPTYNAFNKSLEIGIPCYAIYFVGIPERRLIAEKTVTSVEVVKDVSAQKSVNTESTIELPE